MSSEPQDFTSELIASDMAHLNIESAIASSAEAARGQEGVTAMVLQNHLKGLCDIQRRHLERMADYEYAVATGFGSDDD